MIKCFYKILDCKGSQVLGFGIESWVLGFRLEDHVFGLALALKVMSLLTSLVVCAFNVNIESLALEIYVAAGLKCLLSDS